MSSYPKIPQDYFIIAFTNCPVDSVLSEMNIVHTVPHFLLNIRCNIVFESKNNLWGLPTNMAYAFRTSCMRAASNDHFMTSEIIILIMKRSATHKFSC